MPTIKLLEQEVKKAAHIGGQCTEYWFEGRSGLVLRCYPSGRRTWSFDFQPVINGKRQNRTEKIGDASVLKIDDVRKRRHQLASRNKLELANELDALSARPAAYTVGDLANDWLRRHVRRKLRPNTVREYEYRIRAYVLPELERAPAQELRKRDVIRVIDSIAEESRRGEGAPVLADRVKAIISSMYRWAQREDRLEHNPAQLIDNRAPGRWRDRILADCEIPAFWIGLDSAPVEPSMRYIFRLLLLLGQRRTEVCGALVSEFDLISDVRVWTIGRDRTKNGRTHSIPLPDMAAHFWREAIEQFSDGLHVFPGRDTGGPIDGSSVTRAMRRTREALALQDLTVHDLRRTVRSRMAGIGIRREHSAAALNHIDELHVGVHDEAYNRYNYMVEKLGALRLWETELTRLLAGAEPG